MREFIAVTAFGLSILVMLVNYPYLMLAASLFALSMWLIAGVGEGDGSGKA